MPCPVAPWSAEAGARVLLCAFGSCFLLSNFKMTNPVGTLTMPLTCSGWSDSTAARNSGRNDATSASPT